MSVDRSKPTYRVITLTHFCPAMSFLERPQLGGERQSVLISVYAINLTKELKFIQLSKADRDILQRAAICLNSNHAILQISRLVRLSTRHALDRQ